MTEKRERAESWVIHLFDILDVFVLRHRFLRSVCTRLAQSDWWACDGRDHWCRRFHRDDQFDHSRTPA